MDGQSRIAHHNKSVMPQVEKIVWSRGETKLLIAVLKRFPIIYDTSHKDYFNRNLKHIAYRKVLNYFKARPDLTISLLKKKIRTLRTQLSIELKKMNATSGTDNPYVPKLWCFHKIKFLLGADAESLNETTPNKSEEDLSDLMILPENYANISLNSRSSLNSTLESCENSQKKIKEERLKRIDTNAKVEELIQVAQASFAAVADMRANAAAAKNPLSSKAQLFCNYLSSQLDELSATTFDRVTHKILGLVIEAKEREKSANRSRTSATSYVNEY